MRTTYTQGTYTPIQSSVFLLAVFDTRHTVHGSFQFRSFRLVIEPYRVFIGDNSCSHNYSSYCNKFCPRFWKIIQDVPGKHPYALGQARASIVLMGQTLSMPHLHTKGGHILYQSHTVPGVPGLDGINVGSVRGRRAPFGHQEG